MFESRRVRLIGLMTIAVLLLGAGVAAAQEEDLNIRYAFPLSLGAEYQMLTPFGAYAGGYNVFEAGLSVRVPIPGAPTFQPVARLGIIQFTGTEADTETGPGTESWSHTHYYGGLGLVWANRIDKTFELALELIGGLSEAVFPDLVPEAGSVGNLNLFAELGGRISLDPSYSLSIDIHPSIKYIQSVGVLQDFNGPIFGIGFGVNYRFGEDPDAPGQIIRSIRFSDIVFPDAFAAMQSYYASNPIGSVVIENTDKNPIADLQVSFEQKGFMEAPTRCASIEELGPDESITVDLLASYNANVFTTEGTTPLVGEIIATYTSQGKPAEQRSSVSYVLRDKTNMTWTDDAKVAAFITYEDSALRNYASWVRQACKEDTIDALSGSLQTAIQIYEALGELGCLYQSDPSKPAFEEVQGNPIIIDSVSLPRDTLARTTGDCDDLTVLYCSLLESVGIDTGFITVPGHIYAAFNTGVAARDYRKVHPDRGMTLPIDGELWVPVEITLIGEQGFMNAWRRGIDEWLAQDNNPEGRELYLTAVAQETYWPVGLQQTDLGLQYGSTDAISEAFRRQLSRLTSLVVADYRERAESSGRRQDYNRLGIAYSTFEQFDAAAGAFGEALRIDPGYDSARVNLANLRFLEGDFRRALTDYENVYRRLETAGETDSPLAAKVLLNVSRAQYELERYDEARESYAQAEQIDAAVVADFAFLGTITDTAGRAAEQSGPEILFVDED